MTDWPKPGDKGYAVADYDCADMNLTLEGLETELAVFFVEKEGGTFYVRAITPSTQNSFGRWTVPLEEFNPEDVRQTLAESLHESARRESDYANKHLAVAFMLERIAAQSEGKTWRRYD